MLPNARLEHCKALNLCDTGDSKQIQDNPDNSIFSSDFKLMNAWSCSVNGILMSLHAQCDKRTWSQLAGMIWYDHV